MKKYSSSSTLLTASIKYPPHNQNIKYQKYETHNTSYTNMVPKTYIPQKNISKRAKNNKQNLSKQPKKKTQDYQVLKEKINSLQERLGNIRKNYDLLHNNRMKKSIKEANTFNTQENSLSSVSIPNNNPFKNDRYHVQSPKHSFEVSKPFIPQKTEKQKKSKRYSVNQDEGHNLSDFVTKYDARQSAALHCVSTSNLLLSVQAPQDKSKHTYYISNIISAFNTDKPSSFHQLCRNHLISSIDFINFIQKSNKKLYIPAPIPKKLPFPTRQTIIFDLDETLIHCNESLTMPHDIALPIQFPDKNVVTVGINIRPYVNQCLKQLRKYFQLVIFTASHSCYANVIVNHLDPKNQIFSFRFFREHCHKTQEGFYVKDLRVIDRDLSKTLLIDNAAYSYCFQPQNGVPIVPFYDSKADFELKSLCSYLKSMYGLGDIRKRNDDCMKLSQYKRFINATSLITSLYQ